MHDFLHDQPQAIGLTPGHQIERRLRGCGLGVFFSWWLLYNPALARPRLQLAVALDCWRGAHHRHLPWVLAPLGRRRQQVSHCPLGDPPTQVDMLKRWCWWATENQTPACRTEPDRDPARLSRR